MATAMQLGKELRSRALKQALAQVYIIYGPAPSTSLKLAEELARFLECGAEATEDQVLVDAQVVDGARRKMGIDEARSYAAFLFKKPVLSARRTLIIHRPDLFTNEAQNALLKMTEEPPAHALIIFTVRDPHALAQTLGSRAQKLYCGERPLPADQTEVEREAHDRALRFLALRASERGAFIKALVEEESEIRDAMSKARGPGIVHEAYVVEPFVSALIQELARDPQNNLRPLAEALKRQSLMADHTVSKKIQLEAISTFLP